MTEKDWHVTDEKIAAIKGTPSPKNVAELRSYLGLLNYYGNFIPSLSTLLQPLHELLRKGVKWAWTEECEKAFVRSKSELVADKVLVSYDERRKLILTCDACTATEMIPTIEMTPNHHRNDTGGHHLNDPRNIGNGIKRTTKTGQQFSACFLFIYIASFLRCVIYLLPHFILQ